VERKETKKAAKRIIKQYKKHPNWYTPEEVLYAKLVKKSLKLLKNNDSNSN